MPAFTLLPGSAALTIVSTGNTLAITTIDGGTAEIAGGGSAVPSLSMVGSNSSMNITKPKTITLAMGNTYALSSGAHTLTGTY